MYWVRDESAWLSLCFDERFDTVAVADVRLQKLFEPLALS